MNDNLAHARGWLRKADSDLAAARRLLAGRGPFDAVCFHAQQSAEKDLKALLAFAERPIPHTHNVEELLGWCLELQPTSGLSGLDVVELTPYAVQMRYDFEFWPDQATAVGAVALAERVRQAVRDMLPSAALP